jgi:hypothetical protein
VSWEEDYVQELGPSKFISLLHKNAVKTHQIKASAKFFYMILIFSSAIIKNLTLSFSTDHKNGFDEYFMNIALTYGYWLEFDEY